MKLCDVAVWFLLSNHFHSLGSNVLVSEIYEDLAKAGVESFIFIVFIENLQPGL